MILCIDELCACVASIPRTAYDTSCQHRVVGRILPSAFGIKAEAAAGGGKGNRFEFREWRIDLVSLTVLVTSSACTTPPDAASAHYRLWPIGVVVGELPGILVDFAWMKMKAGAMSAVMRSLRCWRRCRLFFVDGNRHIIVAGDDSTSSSLRSDDASLGALSRNASLVFESRSLRSFFVSAFHVYRLRFARNTAPRTAP